MQHYLAAQGVTKEVERKSVALLWRYCEHGSLRAQLDHQFGIIPRRQFRNK